MEELNSKVVETTRKFIRNEFQERFKKTRESILLEEKFQKVAEFYIRREVPACLRTEKALTSNSDAILKMKKEIDSFLYKIKSKELGWQYVLRKDGQEYLKLFDETGELIIESNFYHNVQEFVTQEQQISNMLKRWTHSFD